MSIHLKICAGINCSVRGGQELLELVETNDLFQKKCKIEYVECLEKCEDGINAPVVWIDGEFFTRVTPESLSNLLNQKINTISD
ncbi:MAG: NAD(P)H-dependent oxidoreductase subunit E [Promethearchaeota archaeon]